MFKKIISTGVAVLATSTIGAFALAEEEATHKRVEMDSHTGTFNKHENLMDKSYNFKSSDAATWY